MVLSLKKINAVSLAAICIAMIVGLVIHDFAGVQIADYDSNPSPTNSTLPENQLEPETEPAEPGTPL